MKNLLKLIVLSVMLSLGGCGTKEPYVKTVKDVMPTVTAIRVTGDFELRFLGIFIATIPVQVQGAGVFVSPNNHVLTCAHLFDLHQINSISVETEDGTTTAGVLMSKNDRTDLALVKTFFDTPTAHARIADPRTLEVGQQVLAIGSPLGFPFSVSHGIISALNRDQVGYNMTQSDTFLNPGNSGGPLFNLAGELVGINSRIVPPVPAPIFTGLGFSTSPGQIIEFLTDYSNVDAGVPRIKKGYWGKLMRVFR